MNEKQHPLIGAASRALEKANALGGADLASWDSSNKCWNVASASDPNTTYHVRRKNQELKADGNITSKLTTGPSIGWLFTLDCDCPAVVVSGRAACWHKGAVRLWWSAHSALDGDQIARRNLLKAKAKKMLADIEEAERLEAEEGGGPFQHNPPADAQDGADPHQFNRRMAPLDRGTYYESNSEWIRRSGDIFDGDGELWDAPDPPYYAEVGSEERLPW